jgi:hypothetical protein
MALVILSGFPCSGKTTRAHQIKEMLESKLAQDANDHVAMRKVAIINDELVGVTRSVYDGELLAFPRVSESPVEFDKLFQSRRKQVGEGGPGKSTLTHHSQTQ